MSKICKKELKVTTKYKPYRNKDDLIKMAYQYLMPMEEKKIKNNVNKLTKHEE